MDFESICRVCLTENNQTYNIYTCIYIKTNTLYSEMLSSCTKIKPHKEDGLPKFICKECCRQLKRAYTFNLQCEASDKKLKCLKQELDLKNNDTDVKNEELNEQIKNENGIEFSNIEMNKPSMLEIQEENKDDIKLEPSFLDEVDDSWDEYDDNVILKEIKIKKSTEGDVTLTVLTNDELLEKPKKKRGRKKKVYTEGETPPVPESKLPHQCDVCGKFMSNKSNLKAHKICHTDLRPYKCPECPATFRGYSALFQHKRVHSGETPYHCEFCSKQFSRRTGLVNHIRIHTGEKLFSCEICFKNFAQSAQLSTHMKRHKGDKPYLCQDCGKGFPIKAELKVHQRVHNGEKPYSCHLCTKTFATSGNLSIHIRIHNKEVRYNCKECQRGFVTRSAFNVHVKRHKGQRDYHCECGKTFYTSSALKQHKVVHTGEKKYQCKICDRKFTQTSHLSRHFKRNHAKPNVPLPSSDEYKLVIDANKGVIGLFDGAIQKIPPTNGVKCEGP